MKLIPLTRGKFAKVDDDDLELVSQYSWHASDGRHGKFYANCKEKISMHRLILNAPSSFLVDHINGDTLDNRRDNLRTCTRAQNAQNIVKTGYKGVSKWKHYKRWRSYIVVDYKQIHLGYYDTKEEAAKAYNEAAIKYFGEFASLNNIVPTSEGVSA